MKRRNRKICGRKPPTMTRLDGKKRFFKCNDEGELAECDSHSEGHAKECRRRRGRSRENCSSHGCRESSCSEHKCRDQDRHQKSCKKQHAASHRKRFDNKREDCESSCEYHARSRSIHLLKSNKHCRRDCSYDNRHESCCSQSDRHCKICKSEKEAKQHNAARKHKRAHSRVMTLTAKRIRPASVATVNGRSTVKRRRTSVIGRSAADEAATSVTTTTVATARHS